MKNKSKKKTDDRNYLDFVPVYNEKYPFDINEDGSVIIKVENKGVFNKIAQVVFKKPRISQIHLDEMGNFIWPNIDGKRSIYDIAVLVKEHFKEKADPLYPRIVQYFKTLESYGFIKFSDTLSQDNTKE